MGGFNVVHDLLDMQLVDRAREKMGRVDDLVVELRDGAPPRLAAIVVGAPARSARIGGWWAAVGRVMRRAFGLAPATLTRLPFTEVREIAKVIAVDVVGIDTPAMRAERRLRRVVGRVPGSHAKQEPHS